MNFPQKPRENSLKLSIILISYKISPCILSLESESFCFGAQTLIDLVKLSRSFVQNWQKSTCLKSEEFKVPETSRGDLKNFLMSHIASKKYFVICRLYKSCQKLRFSTRNWLFSKKVEQNSPKSSPFLSTLNWSNLSIFSLVSGNVFCCPKTWLCFAYEYEIFNPELTEIELFFETVHIFSETFCDHSLLENSAPYSFSWFEECFRCPNIKT